MKLAVPDLVSNSYFPAIAAVEMGLLADEGYDVDLELVFPVSRATRLLAAGELDFVAGAAHGTLLAFPEWRGAKLLAALARHMYWFLVVRTDLRVARGDLDAIRGLRIGAAPGVDLGLMQLLRDVGIDPDSDVSIVPIPGLGEGSVSFGVNAARALAEGVVDGFWANGMGAEIAVADGAGSVVLDVRRGDGPSGARSYTFGALITTDAMVREQSDLCRAMVRALVRAQTALRDDPDCATPIARKLFPAREAELIAKLVERDAPYYGAVITPEDVASLNAFAQASGLATGDPGYDAVVAAEVRELWV